MRKADQMMNTDYSILLLHCCQGWDFSINSCVGGQSCRKSTSQFNLSGMDRYWLYRIYRSRCSTAVGSSCRKSYGYCQYGTVSLLWKSRPYHRWKYLYWWWHDKTNDLPWWLWLDAWWMKAKKLWKSGNKEFNCKKCRNNAKMTYKYWLEDF